jgi:hypothetical protein
MPSQFAESPAAAAGAFAISVLQHVTARVHVALTAAAPAAPVDAPPAATPPDGAAPPCATAPVEPPAAEGRAVPGALGGAVVVDVAVGR